MNGRIPRVKDTVEGSSLAMRCILRWNSGDWVRGAGAGGGGLVTAGRPSRNKIRGPVEIYTQQATDIKQKDEETTDSR
jgi:hypothetical protein